MTNKKKYEAARNEAAESYFDNLDYEAISSIICHYKSGTDFAREYTIKEYEEKVKRLVEALKFTRDKYYSDQMCNAELNARATSVFMEVDKILKELGELDE